MSDMTEAEAMCNRAVTIGNKRDYNGAIKAYEELISKYGNSEDPGEQEHIAGWTPIL